MISYHLISKVGERDNNEDSVGMFQAGAEYCFALADGLGGHGKGEVASRIAVEQAVAAFAEAGKASEEVIRTAASWRSGRWITAFPRCLWRRERSRRSRFATIRTETVFCG